MIYKTLNYRAAIDNVRDKASGEDANGVQLQATDVKHSLLPVLQTSICINDKHTTLYSYFRDTCVNMVVWPSGNVFGCHLKIRIFLTAKSAEGQGTIALSEHSRDGCPAPHCERAQKILEILMSKQHVLVHSDMWF